MGKTGISMAVAVALALALAVSSPASAQNRKNHLTVTIGYQNFTNEDLEDFGGGLDFSDASSGSLNYRLSLSPKFDLTLDAYSTFSSQSASLFVDYPFYATLDADYAVMTTFFGPGLRWIAPREGIRPFVQGNVFIVGEYFTADYGSLYYSASDYSAGFGLSAGVDIRASNLLSIPIQADYMYGKPADDLSTFGFNFGLTFNFGEMK